VISESIEADYGRTIWIADAHRGDGKRFIVRADGKLTAFVESLQNLLPTEKSDQNGRHFRS
jgi:hypothetical protein